MKHRPTIERMQYMAARLRSGEAFNCNSVAAHFEVTNRTIRRDLDFMRDRLGYEIKYDARRFKFVTGYCPMPIL